MDAKPRVFSFSTACGRRAEHVMLDFLGTVFILTATEYKVIQHALRPHNVIFLVSFVLLLSPKQSKCFTNFQLQMIETIWWTEKFAFRACLHGGGGPPLGEITFDGSPHQPGVPHLHVNRPLLSTWINRRNLIIMMIIITYLTRVNPSAEAVINGCPGQLKNWQLKEKITISDQLSEKCKNYVQCRWIKTKNYITT